jgi:tRNA G26 N,N-dimethylase Trm1
MWIGPMGDKDVMASMTVERSLELCGAIYSENDPANWSQKNVELENRKVARAVRNIAEEAEAIDSHHLIAVDELARWHEKGSPPSPAKMVAYLKEKGHSASVSHYAEPSFRTDAPWSAVVAAMDAIGSAANDR